MPDGIRSQWIQEFLNNEKVRKQINVEKIIEKYFIVLNSRGVEDTMENFRFFVSGYIDGNTNGYIQGHNEGFHTP